MEKSKKIKFEYKNSDKKEGVFEGYLSTYENKDLENDVIKTGAFAKTVKNRGRVPLLYNHDHNEIIGFLDLSENQKGLFVEAELFLDESEKARVVYKSLKNGSLSEMSVGFSSDDYKYNEKNRGYDFNEVEVYEGSVVITPANPEAKIETVKKVEFENGFDFEKEVEKILIKHNLINKAENTEENKEKNKDYRAEIDEIFKNALGKEKNV